MSRLKKFLVSSKRGCDMFEKHPNYCGECVWRAVYSNMAECTAPMLAFKRREFVHDWLENLCLESVN